MPIQMVDEKEKHRHRIAAFDFQFNILVAEPVPKTQRKQLPKAQAECDKERDKLLKRTTWDPTTVKESSRVSHMSTTTGVKVHVAKMFDICAVKRAGLDDKDP